MSALVEAVGLLREVAWSTQPVEQQHASLGISIKYHPNLEKHSLATRAFLHICRNLVAIAPPSRELKRVQQEIGALQKKQPRKMSGSSARNSHVVNQVMASGKGGPPSFAQTQQLLGAASSSYAELPAAMKDAWKARARETGHAMDSERREQLAIKAQERDDVLAKQAADLLNIGKRNRLGELKLEMSELAGIGEALQTDRPPATTLQRLRDERLKAPRAPPPQDRASLSRQVAGVVEPTGVGLTQFVRFLAANRDMMKGLAFSSEAANDDMAFVFLYASQNPLRAYFMPAKSAVSELPNVAGKSFREVQEAMMDFAGYSFEIMPCSYCTDLYLNFVDISKVWVWLGIGFHGMHMVATNNEPVPFAFHFARPFGLHQNHSEQTLRKMVWCCWGWNAPKSPCLKIAGCIWLSQTGACWPRYKAFII